jgi:hypothetical protein
VGQATAWRPFIGGCNNASFRKLVFVLIAFMSDILNHAPGFVQAHQHLFLALYEETQAKRMAQHMLKSKFVVVPCVHSIETNGCEQFVPSPLQEIYRFDELANQASRQNAGLRLVFCAGLNPVIQARVAFLLGCHMLISLEMDPGAVNAAAI